MASLRLLGLLVGLLAALPAGAAERVNVRIGEHPGFSRLVFDWPGAPKVQLERKPGRAILQFDRPGELDLARFRADPPPDVSDVAADARDGRLRVTVTFARAADLRLSRYRGDVVLDVLHQGTQPDAPPATREDGRRRRAAQGRDRATPPAPAAAPVPPRKPAAQGAPAAPGTEESAADARMGGPLSILPRETPGGAGAASAPPRSGRPAAPVRVETNRPAAQGPSPDPGTRDGEPGPRASAVPPDGLVSTAAPRALIDSVPLPTWPPPGAAPVELRFDWPAEVAAAAFRVGPHLWLVFDRPAPGDLTGPITTLAPQTAPVEQFEASGATFIRLAASPAMAPRMRRDGAAWVLDLWPRTARADGEIDVAVDAEGRPARVVFRVKGAGRALRLAEPDLASELIVVPLRAAEQRLATAREFTQFRALPSAQGLVLRLFSDDARVRVEEDAVSVDSAAGVIVSHAGTLALLKSNARTPEHGPRLFDLAAWRRGGAARFAGNKHDLRAALAQSEPHRLAVARFDLARFYFAHGLAAEALGLLHLGEAVDPRLSEDPEARLMKGAGAFLIGDFDGAAEELYHPSVAGEWEASLWHAAMAAVGRDWVAATAKFAEAEDLIAAYPHGVRARLRFLAAEAHLAVGDAEGADRYLDRAREDDPSLAEQAQIAFLLGGRRLQIEDDTEGAEKLWRKVAASADHKPSQIRARLALLDLGLQSGRTTVGEAIEELESLRFAWRGDGLERALLLRLGDLYVRQGAYRRALHALRQAASYFPDPGGSSAVAQRMRELFVDVHLGRTDGGPDAAGAVALYDEFKELTPPGSEGDAVINRLAERLVEIDLLERAAELLRAQVKYRLSGLPKAHAGARLALIRLLDEAPQDALDALEASAVPDLPEDLVRERARLRARALSGLGRPEEALALVADDDAPEALRLRAEILWSRRQWPAAAAALRPLLPDPPAAGAGLSALESRDVLHVAVALTMAGERARLVELARSYGAAMATGAYGNTFALLAGGLEPGTAKSIAEELAEVERVEAFLADYRERLRGAGPAGAE